MLCVTPYVIVRLLYVIMHIYIFISCYDLCNYWDGRDCAPFHIVIIVYAPLILKLNYLAMHMLMEL